jgi:hypothetical protein
MAAEVIAAISAAGLSAIAAILVAKMRLESISAHGPNSPTMDALRRIEDRLQTHGERLAHLEALVE